MAGGGGSGTYKPGSDALRRKIEEARRQERERFEGDVADYLRTVLAVFNDRDSRQTSERIEQIRDALGDSIGVEAFLFGGSVAKHTYVDGLSDVDALAILDRDDLRGTGSDRLLTAFEEILQDKLSRAEVASIRRGDMAVTVNYRDGAEVQILPAIREGASVSVPDPRTGRWNSIEPKAFQRLLTSSNQRLNNNLVPAIKLVKSIVADFPKQQKVSGYHVESLALDAVKKYRGEKTTKALVLHILNHAADRVRSPIKDVTGQSRFVDEYMGKTDSTARRNASLALAAVHRRLNAASSVAQWKTMFREQDR